MIKLVFSDEEKDKLFKEHRETMNPRVRNKLLAVYLKSLDTEHSKICEICRVSWPTMLSYFKEYQEGGIEGLTISKHKGRPSEMNLHADVIKAAFVERPPATIKEARSRIEEITGLTRSIPQVWSFLNRIGFRLRKVGGVPGKANIAEQDAFKKKQLEPRLKEAEEGKREVYFVDAAHFVLAPFFGLLWCLSRIFIRTPAGRNRLNVLGALNAISKKLVTITNETYVNADTVMELLDKLRCLHPEKLITVVLDNARYQKCQAVFALAKELDIELLYLPGYSPNLNLIERLWKFIKKKCLYSEYYENFMTFKAAIMGCIADLPTKHDEQLKSLSLQRHFLGRQAA